MSPRLPPPSSTPTGRKRLFPESVGTGPTVHSSQFETYQDALDSAGSGKLLIDDTKTEEGITISDANDGVVIEWVGDNWIEQPANPTLGEAVLRAASDVAARPSVTFVRPQIRNPSLGDVDIGDEDTVAGGDRTSAIEWFPPAATSPGDPGRITLYEPNLHHVNGYGVNFRNVEAVNIVGGRSSWTAFDGFCFSGDGSAFGSIRDVEVEQNGRHGIAPLGGFDQFTTSGLIRDPYTSGWYTENSDGTDFYLNLEIRNPVRRTTGIHRRAIEGASGTLHGRAVVYNLQNCNNFGNRFDGELQDFTLVVKRDDASVGNNNDVPAARVNVTGSNSSATFIVSDEGSTGTAGAIHLITAYSGEWEIQAQGTPGPAAHIERSQKNRVVINSENPCQTTTTDNHHVSITGISTELSVDNDVQIIARDANGNAAYGVVGGANEDYNRLSGNVRGAYATAATDALSTNDDTTDMIQ